MRRRSSDCLGALCGAYRQEIRWHVIRSFADKRTAAVFAGHVIRGLSTQVQRRVRAKLLAIEVAVRLDDLDLRASPGNRLEALRGDRRGQHSIRVREVRIVDYH